MGAERRAWNEDGDGHTRGRTAAVSRLSWRRAWTDPDEGQERIEAVWQANVVSKVSVYTFSGSCATDERVNRYKGTIPRYVS